MKTILSRFAFLTAVGLALLLLTPQASFACSRECCGWIGPLCYDWCDALQIVDEDFAGETSVIPLGDDRALVSIAGFATTEMEGGSICTASITGVEGISGVKDLTVLDGEGMQIRELKWQPNEASGASAAALSREEGLVTPEAWHGFFTTVSAHVEDQRPMTFVFEVTLQEGFTPLELTSALREDGVLATGGATPDGALTLGHAHLTRLGTGDVSLVFPAARELPSKVKPLTPEIE